MELRLLLLEFFGGINAIHSLHRAVLLGLGLSTVALALLPALVPSRAGVAAKVWSGCTLFYAVMAGLMFWARWPAFLAPQLNPDEGIFTAAATALLHDPVFWRAADTGSSGPLNVYPLLFLTPFGFVPDLATSRIAGLLMMITSVCLLHATLRHLYNDSVARLATLPIAATIAMMQFWDYVHISSEHCPILILSLMLYLIARPRRPSAGALLLRAFMVGLVGGLVPFAKMQGLPIAMALAAVFVHSAWLEGPRRATLAGALLAMLLGALTPFALALLTLATFSLTEWFWLSYVRANLLTYMNMQAGGLPSKLGTFLGLLAASGELRPLGWVGALAAALAVGLQFVRVSLGKKLASSHPSRPVLLYATVYLVAAMFAVIRPGNAFAHYLLFLIMPAGLLIGAALGELKKCRPTAGAVGAAFPVTAHGVLAAAIVLATLTVFANRVRGGSIYLPKAPVSVQTYRSDIAMAIRQAAPIGSSMVVWGFSPDLYLQSGMIPSTRFGFTSWQIENTRMRDVFVEQFVADMDRTKPKIFVDAIAPGMFYTSPIDPAVQGHDANARVKAVVARDYTLATALRGVRIYRRTDLETAQRE